jgi:hypothetical protein
MSPSASLDNRLWFAARAGDAKDVASLLAGGANAHERIYLPDPFDRSATRSMMTRATTALMEAAAAGKADCVAALLTASDPAQVDSEGRSALGRAARRGEVACVAILIEADDPAERLPKITRPGGYRSCALICAVESGSLECLRLVAERCALEPGMDGQAPSARHPERSALVVAAESGAADMVELLLALGADPKADGGDGFTALMAAAKSRSPACVALLVPVSDAARVDAWDRSALGLAAQERRPGAALAVEALLERLPPDFPQGQLQSAARACEITGLFGKDMTALIAAHAERLLVQAAAGSETSQPTRPRPLSL